MMKILSLLLIAALLIVGAPFLARPALAADSVEGVNHSYTSYETTVAVTSNTTLIATQNLARISAFLLDETGATNTWIGCTNSLTFGKGRWNLPSGGSLTIELPSCVWQGPLYGSLVNTAAVGVLKTNTVRFIEFLASPNQH